MLSEWSHWSDCSSTCGDGVQVRQKMIKRPAQGQGRQCDSEDMKQMRDCNMGQCEVQDFKLCMVSSQHRQQILCKCTTTNIYLSVGQVDGYTQFINIFDGNESGSGTCVPMKLMNETK